MFEQLPQLFQSVFDISASMMPTNFHLRLVSVLEISVLGFILYRAYRFIAGTHAEQLLKGILMLFVALGLSKLFNLQIIGKVLEIVVNIVIFSLVVIFQPELRRLLGYLGQKGFLSKHIATLDSESEAQKVVDEIVNAVKHMSKARTGALMVFYNNQEVNNVIEVGTKLDSEISTELILTIFHPNTPLHDGAVVIRQNRILASGVLLPLTEDPKLSWQYGTRHRAAIGMSEVSDAACIVVSEETGNISIAQGGKLAGIQSLEELRTELEFIYGISDTVNKKAEKAINEKNKFRFQDIFFLELPLAKKDDGKRQ